MAAFPHPLLTPQLLLRAYAAGVFPMAEGRDDTEVFWVDPKERGILPLEDFHVPRSLKKAVRRKPFRVTCDTAFASVIASCAESSDNRDDTWINTDIEAAYTELHDLDFAHSVECWDGEKLVGGLYGVSLGGAFFGESMFSRATDASKIALVHLVVRLMAGGYVLLDTQFVTDHLRQFGAIEIPAFDYHHRLETALRVDARFYSEMSEEDVDSGIESLFAQSRTQTS